MRIVAIVVRAEDTIPRTLTGLFAEKLTILRENTADNAIQSYILTHAATSAMSCFVCLDTITRDLELMAREQGGDDMKKSGGDVCGSAE